MLSSASSGIAATGFTVVVGEPVAGMHLQAERRAMARRLPEAREMALASPRRRLRSPPRNRRRYAARPPARRARFAASSCRRSGSMKSETRMPASPSSLDEALQMIVPAGRVEPAFGGALLAPLRHDAGGMRPVPERDRQHLVGRRHLEIERQASISMASRVMSPSVMWRRSSRRCAVMPSAPAFSASSAARTGSGSPPPRAFRTVATWSMLTPRRECRAHGIRFPLTQPARSPCGRRSGEALAARLSGRPKPLCRQ